MSAPNISQTYCVNGHEVVVVMAADRKTARLFISNTIPSGKVRDVLAYAPVSAVKYDGEWVAAKHPAFDVAEWMNVADRHPDYPEGFLCTGKVWP